MRDQRSSVRVGKLEIIVEHDDSSDPEDIISGDREYEREERERIAAYHRGEWHFVGVYLRVQLTVEGTIQYIRTPGLWGIESESADSDKDVRFVADDEHDTLVGILEALGIDPGQVPPVSAGRVVWR